VSSFGCHGTGRLDCAGALIGALITWAVSFFVPGVYRHVIRRPALHVHQERDRAVIWAGSPPWVTYGFMVECPDELGEPPSEFYPIGGLRHDRWEPWMRTTPSCN
jgi:hypothetical protein